MGEGGDVLDPVVERLKICVEEGREIHVEEDGSFRFGSDDTVIPKNTMCECPWKVKDPETKEMMLERASLATLVLLVQTRSTNTWRQYVQASKRAGTPALSLWSFKNAQRFFVMGTRDSAPPLNTAGRTGVRRLSRLSALQSSISSSPPSPSQAAGNSAAAAAAAASGGGGGGEYGDRKVSGCQPISQGSDGNGVEENAKCAAVAAVGAAVVSGDEMVVGGDGGGGDGDGGNTPVVAGPSEGVCESIRQQQHLGIRPQEATSSLLLPSPPPRIAGLRTCSVLGYDEAGPPETCLPDAAVAAASRLCAEPSVTCSDSGPPTIADSGASAAAAAANPMPDSTTVPDGVAVAEGGSPLSRSTNTVVISADTFTDTPATPSLAKTNANTSTSAKASTDAKEVVSWFEPGEEWEASLAQTQAQAQAQAQAQVPIPAQPSPAAVATNGTNASKEVVVSWFEPDEDWEALSPQVVPQASTTAPTNGEDNARGELRSWFEPDESWEDSETLPPSPKSATHNDDDQNVDSKSSSGRNNNNDDNNNNNNNNNNNSRSGHENINDTSIINNIEEVRAWFENDDEWAASETPKISEGGSGGDRDSGVVMEENDSSIDGIAGGEAALTGAAIEKEASFSATLSEGDRFITLATVREEGSLEAETAVENNPSNTSAEEERSTAEITEDVGSPVAVEEETSAAANPVGDASTSPENTEQDAHGHAPSAAAEEHEAIAAASGEGHVLAVAKGGDTDSNGGKKGVGGVVEMVGLPRELMVAQLVATRIGAVVRTKAGHVGIVRFAGLTEFATGLWLGLELDEPRGKNDGSTGLKRYFKCSDKHGLFVRPTNITLLEPAPAAATAAGADTDADASAASPAAAPNSTPAHSSASIVADAAPGDVVVEPEVLAESVSADANNGGDGDAGVGDGRVNERVGVGCGNVGDVSTAGVEPEDCVEGGSVVVPTITKDGVEPAADPLSCHEVVVDAPSSDVEPQGSPEAAEMPTLVTNITNDSNGNNKSNPSANDNVGGAADDSGDDPNVLGSGEVNTASNLVTSHAEVTSTTGPTGGDADSEGSSTRNRVLATTINSSDDDSDTIDVGEDGCSYVTVSGSGVANLLTASSVTSHAVNASTAGTKDLGAEDSKPGSRSSSRSSSSGSNSSKQDGGGGIRALGRYNAGKGPWPPRSRSTGGRSPWTEIVESRRHSVDNTAMPPPSGASASLPASVVAAAATAFATREKKHRQQPHLWSPADEDEMESVRLLSPSTTSPPKPKDEPGPSQFSFSGRECPTPSAESMAASSNAEPQTASASGVRGIGRGSYGVGRSGAGGNGGGDAGRDGDGGVANDTSGCTGGDSSESADPTAAAIFAAAFAANGGGSLGAEELATPTLAVSSRGTPRQQRVQPEEEARLAAAAAPPGAVRRESKLCVPMAGKGKSNRGDTCTASVLVRAKAAASTSVGMKVDGSPQSTRFESRANGDAAVSGSSSSPSVALSAVPLPIAQKKSSPIIVKTQDERNVTHNQGTTPEDRAVDVATVRKGIEVECARTSAHEPAGSANLAAATMAAALRATATPTVTSTTGVNVDSSLLPDGVAEAATATSTRLVVSSPSPECVATANKDMKVAVSSGGGVPPSLSATATVPGASATATATTPDPAAAVAAVGTADAKRVAGFYERSVGAGLCVVAGDGGSDDRSRACGSSAPSPASSEPQEECFGNKKDATQVAAVAPPVGAEASGIPDDDAVEQPGPLRAVHEGGVACGGGEFGGGDAGEYEEYVSLGGSVGRDERGGVGGEGQGEGGGGGGGATGRGLRLAACFLGVIVSLALALALTAGAAGGTPGGGGGVALLVAPETPGGAFKPLGKVTLQGGAAGTPLAHIIRRHGELSVLHGRSSLGSHVAATGTGAASFVSSNDGSPAGGRGMPDGGKLGHRPLGKANRMVRGWEEVLQGRVLRPVAAPPSLVGARETRLSFDMLLAMVRASDQHKSARPDEDGGAVLKKVGTPSPNAAGGGGDAPAKALLHQTLVKKMSDLEDLMESRRKEYENKRQSGASATSETGEVDHPIEVVPIGSVPAVVVTEATPQAEMARPTSAAEAVQSGSIEASTSSAWVRKLSSNQVLLQHLEQQPQQQRRQQSPQCSKTRAAPWRRNPNPVYRPPPPPPNDAGVTEAETESGSTRGLRLPAAKLGEETPPRRAEEELEAAGAQALPAFMRPGGGMVPVAFLTGCDAATIAPDSGEWCKSTPMLLGYTAKNLLELVEPGEVGEIVWQSRKSLVNTMKQSLGFAVSSWFRREIKDNSDSINPLERNESGPFMPPRAVAGLYLRETPDYRLAIMNGGSSGGVVPRSASGGGGNHDHIVKVGIQRGVSRVDFGVVLEGDSVPSSELGQSERDAGTHVGDVVEGGGKMRMGAAGLEETTGIEMMELGGALSGEERKERYAAMLTREGHLCVFGTKGGVRCVSSDVHRWVTHVSDGNAP